MPAAATPAAPVDPRQDGAGKEYVAAEVDRRAAQEQFAAWLVEDDYVPDDVLSAMRVTTMTCTYLLNYVFEVDWGGAWSAEFGHDEQESYVSHEWRRGHGGKNEFVPVMKTRTKTRWVFNSGNVGGETTYAAPAGQEASVIGAGAARVCPKRGEQAAPSPGISSADSILSVDEVYERTHADELSGALHERVQSIVGGRRVRGLSSHITREAWRYARVYTPVWRLEFQYGQEKFVFSAPAWKERQEAMLEGTRPFDAERRKKVEGFYARHRGMKMTLLLLLVLGGVAILGCLFAGATGAGGTGSTWKGVAATLTAAVGIGAIVQGVRMSMERKAADRRKEQLLKTSRAVRERELEVYLQGVRQAIAGSVH